MAQREVVICEDITVQPPEGTPGDAVTHKHVRFILEILLADTRWADGYPAIRDGREVEEAFTDAQPGDRVLLREPLWERLRDVVEKPRFHGGGSIHPWLARALLPFMDAIRSAERAGKEESNGDRDPVDRDPAARRKRPK